MLTVAHSLLQPHCHRIDVTAIFTHTLCCTYVLLVCCTLRASVVCSVACAQWCRVGAVAPNSATMQSLTAAAVLRTHSHNSENTLTVYPSTLSSSQCECANGNSAARRTFRFCCSRCTLMQQAHVDMSNYSSPLYTLLHTPHPVCETLRGCKNRRVCYWLEVDLTWSS
jgi:hypothetical protein